MNRRVAMTGVGVLLCGSMLVVTQGCNKADIDAAIKKNKPLILQTVRTVASRGSEEGLKAWAKKNPAAAKEAADALAVNLTSVVAYLNGGNLGSSEAVQTVVNSTLLTDKIPDEVKTAILAASAVLDLYLPVPDAVTALNQDQLDYLKAFVEGLQTGVNNFNNRDLKKTWLR